MQSNPAALLDLVTAPTRDPRPCPPTLVFVSHPDDEVVALGGRFMRHARSIFLHVTDGAPRNGADAARYGFPSNDACRAARRHELAAAYDLAGVPADHRLELGIPDQEAATHLDRIADALATTIREYGIAAIVTHPYEGGHPDHDACAVVARCTVDSLPAGERPAIIEAAFYHRGPRGIDTETFLLAPGDDPCIERVLGEEDQRLKQTLFACFPTQRETLAYFGTEVERYRIAPRYDFTRAPQEGLLFYEQFDWGMTGERFRRLVKDAGRCP
jgi:LmbE family N-acetylglucosaminyl deacetylase